MKKTWHGVIISTLICVGLISINSAKAETQRSLLVVSSVDSSITTISPNEVRKLFLGVPVMKGKIQLRPLRNASDPSLEEVFLQKVVFMSKRSYERRLLSSVFRHGGQRPEVYSNLAELVNKLNRSPESLSYMWSDQIENHEGIISKGVLWTGQID